MKLIFLDIDGVLNNDKFQETNPNIVYPKAEIQNCIIHQLRNSSKYVSYKDIKALMAD